MPTHFKPSLQRVWISQEEPSEVTWKRNGVEGGGNPSNNRGCTFPQLLQHRIRNHHQQAMCQSFTLELIPPRYRQQHPVPLSPPNSARAKPTACPKSSNSSLHLRGYPVGVREHPLGPEPQRAGGAHEAAAVSAVMTAPLQDGSKRRLALGAPVGGPEARVRSNGCLPRRCWVEFKASYFSLVTY